MNNKTLNIFLIGIFLMSVTELFAGGIINGVVDKAKVTFTQGAQKNIVLNSIPRKTKSFEFNDIEYFCHQGNFFLLDNEKYLLVEPPRGLKVKELCEGYERIIRGGAVVYYHNGNFYYQKPKTKGFSIVNGPIGAQITKIPENSVKAIINGEEYFVYFNAVFKATPTRSRDIYTLAGYIK